MHACCLLAGLQGIRACVCMWKCTRLAATSLYTPMEYNTQRLRQQLDSHLEKEYEASLAYDVAAEGQGPDAFEGKWCVALDSPSPLPPPLSNPRTHAPASGRGMSIHDKPLQIIHRRSRMRHPKAEEVHAPIATGVPLDVCPLSGLMSGFSYLHYHD